MIRGAGAVGWRPARPAALAAIASLGVPGQAADPPRYGEPVLACAVFQETVRAAIRSSSGQAAVHDSAGRDGVLVIRGRDNQGGLAIEAWYDSLAVWRRTSEGLERGDTDGFVGGRYRGRLSPTGAWRSAATPFVPDPLAALMDLRFVLHDFLPPLPPVALGPGRRSWSDGSLEIERLDRSRDGAESVYRWRRTATRTESEPLRDSLTVPVEEATEEEGRMTWSPDAGPLRWARRVTVRARVPGRPGVVPAMTSVVEQEIRVERLAGEQRCPPPAR